jgi:hypothetical protein
MTVKDRRFSEPPKYTFKGCVEPMQRYTGDPMALPQNGMTKLSKNRDNHTLLRLLLVNISLN